VIIGGEPGQTSECRIDDPDQVMRAWSMLNASNQELHQVSLPTGAEPRLGRQLQALAAEVGRSPSPALTSELQRLLRPSRAEDLTPAELRVEYAGVLGWTGGLIVAILAQLDKASAPRMSVPGSKRLPVTEPELLPASGFPQTPRCAGRPAPRNPGLPSAIVR
jgi:Protein of unknown function (DUF2587)